MIKDEFLSKYEPETSLAIRALDANDDQSKWQYEALLDYQNLSLDKFLEEYEIFKDEQEFLNFMLCRLDTLILNASNVKAFIKKRIKHF